MGKLKSFFIQSKRVWKLLKKPNKEEYRTIAKVSAIGILIIGAIGFILSDTIKIVARIFG